MDLAGIKCYEKSILDNPSKQLFVKFEERRKCLNTSFWKMFKALQDNQRMILVVDDSSDLEYLNYFFSSYRINELCLVLNNENDFLSPYILEKLKKSLKKQETSSIEKSIRNFENSLVLKEEMIQKLYGSPTDKLSLMAAFQSWHASSGSELDLDVYKLYDRSEYLKVKQLIKRSEKLYRDDFRFNDRFGIFKLNVFNEHTSESLLAILNSFRLDLDELIRDCKAEESVIERSVENQFRDQQERIKALLTKAEDLLEEQAGATRDTKLIEILDKLSVLISLTRDTGEDPGHQFLHYKKQFESDLKETAVKIRKRCELIYEELSIYNTEHKFAEINDRLLLLIDNIEQSNIFSNVRMRFYSSYAYMRDWIHALKYTIDKAIYFIESEHDQLSWCVYYDGLEHRDKILIKALTSVKEDWLSSFENAYLRDMVKNEIHSLSSLTEHYTKDLEDFKEQEKNIALRIVSQYAESFNALSAYNEENPIRWKELLDQHSSELLNRFPVVIMNSENYDQYSQHILPHSDLCVAVNITPRNPEGQYLTEFMYSHYSDIDIRSLEQIEGLELCKLDGVDFNVNRSVSYLNSSELRNLSLYFARSLNYFNSYRLFQTRNCSIISFLSAENTMKLIEMLDKERIKEIFEDKDQNLVSVFFQDQRTKTVLICEDYLLDPKLRSSVMQQSIFLEEIQMSGTELISIDNYKALRYRNDEMAIAVKKILSFGSETPILA